MHADDPWARLQTAAVALYHLIQTDTVAKPARVWQTDLSRARVKCLALRRVLHMLHRACTLLHTQVGSVAGARPTLLPLQRLSS